jgi:hypothetical protein
MDVTQFKACVTCTATIYIEIKYLVYKAVTALPTLYSLFQYKSQFNKVFKSNRGEQGFPITFSCPSNVMREKSVFSCFIYALMNLMFNLHWSVGSPVFRQTLFFSRSRTPSTKTHLL